LAWPTAWIDVIHPNWSVEEGCVFVGVNISEDSVISVKLDDLWQGLKSRALVANETLSPTVWNSVLINCKRSVVAALNLHKSWQAVAVVVLRDVFGVHSRFHVVGSQLPVNIEAPHVEISIFTNSSSVAITSRALADLDLLLTIDFLLGEFNLLRQLNDSLFSHAKLAEFRLSPPVKASLLGDSQRVEGTGSNELDRLSVESLHKLGSGGDFNALGQSQLSLEASAPGVHVGLVSKDQGVELSASNLSDSFVSQRLQNLRSESLFGPSVSDRAIQAWAIGEYVAISGHVEGVVLARHHVLQVTHVVLLLDSRWSVVLSLSLVVLSLSLVVLLKGEHLRWLFIVVVLSLVVSLALVLTDVSQILVIALEVVSLVVKLLVTDLFIVSLPESITGGILHVVLVILLVLLLLLLGNSFGSLRSLTSMSLMSQRLSFFNLLVDMSHGVLRQDLLLLLLKR
jgi:hypothetical protein